MSSKPWIQPNSQAPSQLFIHNSLTKQKTIFVPAKPNSISWYVCGPTVYDKSHLGHARAYITFDIIRRILSDYFKYEVLYVMNITDIDDKIIINARQNHLFEKFCEQYVELSPELAQKGREAWKYFVESKFAQFGLESSSLWSEFIKKDKPDPIAHPKFNMYFKTASEMLFALENLSITSLKDFFATSRDVFQTWLDNRYADTINDPQIFRDFAAYWEKDFFQDMDSLNVLRPDILTRVSEYVPEIVEYVKVIVDNGFAYESGGSVYFDTKAFQDAGHEYAKLVPSAKNNSKLILEGEGALASTSEKRFPGDFALWKKSKSGEPFWDSPWGLGRPGWHIECSVMASAILGKNMDIHSGGIDLAFPHHDNELAQSEAYFNNHQWVNYFLHAGHLHIENLKMSKSLKNFLSIKETLEKTPASTIRLMFLMHAWDAVLDYSSDSISEARQLQSSIQNFMNLVKALREEEKIQKETGRHNYGRQESDLIEQLFKMLENVRISLCDNFDTPKVMLEIKQIISSANSYYGDKQKQRARANVSVLTKIGTEISKLMRIFGVFKNESIIGGFGSSEQGSDSLPVLKAMSSFRDSIRELAQANINDSKVFAEMLKLCDRLRDEDLVEHGVVLEDREGMGALVKLVDKDLLKMERREKELKIEAKKLEKEKRLEEERLKKEAKLEKGKTKPEDLFKNLEFSAWDANGVPTTLADGTPIPKARKKKCEKEMALQKKLHEDYLKSLN